MEIPSKIQGIIGEKCGDLINIGLSGASVHIYEDLVLKIQPQNSESQ